MTIYKPGGGPSPGTKSVSILILDFPAQAEKSPVQLETTGFWARSQGSGDIYNLKRVGVPNKLLYSFSITSLSKATASSELFPTQNACFP